MIDDNISENNGKYYTNEMYLEAEKLLKKREEEIENERKKKLEREKEEIMRQCTEKEREKEIKRLNDEYDSLKPARDEERNKIEQDDSFFNVFYGILKSTGVRILKLAVSSFV